MTYRNDSGLTRPPPSGSSAVEGNRGHLASPAELLLRLTGTVQGVGFRPFVFRLAQQLGVRGWVRNDVHGVELRLSASRETLDDFLLALRTELPPAATIDAVVVQPRALLGAAPPVPVDGTFAILESPADTASNRDVAVTPDLALCEDCRSELLDPANRRYGYAFTNCTNCGPRYSIVRELPYDRPRTTMAGFAMCPECEREYLSPADRRFHAQPNACPVCGPHAELWDNTGAVLATHGEAITRVSAELRAGRIVALKGIGGFHLLADAVNEAAVRELRQRKHRQEKPFAVMFPALGALRAVAEVPEEAAALLTSPAVPIVLVRKRVPANLGDDSGGWAGPPSERTARRSVPTVLAPSVAPNNPWIGALLPYSPLHLLLLEAFGGPVVATSGNLSEEPLCTDEHEALRRLSGIADIFLVHNRPIARPVDDSVVRFVSADDGPPGLSSERTARRSVPTPILLRRARGYAPTPFTLPVDSDPPPMLCLGGHLKNTVAVSAGRRLTLSPHLGDLGNAAATEAFERAIALLTQLYGREPELVVHDAHPDYHSTLHAPRLGRPTVAVQHHLAHVLACLLEHGGGPDRVLGVAWDGTGYGDDGTIWGSEFLLVDRPAHTATRFAHLRPFRLPGGDAAAREPRRSAFALLHEAGRARPPGAPGEWTARRSVPTLGFSEAESALLTSMLEKDVNSPLTTSAGRLFDGVAALLGLQRRNNFEAQAAMALEFAADGARNVPPLSFTLRDSPATGAACEIDWEPALDALASTVAAPTPELAAAFHAGLAEAIVAVARRAGVGTVALTGGCFQNARLVTESVARLHGAGFTVLLHRDLPPNDNAIAAGQALAAAWGITRTTPP